MTSTIVFSLYFYPTPLFTIDIAPLPPFSRIGWRHTWTTPSGGEWMRDYSREGPSTNDITSFSWFFWTHVIIISLHFSHFFDPSPKYEDVIYGRTPRWKIMECTLFCFTGSKDDDDHSLTCFNFLQNHPQWNVFSNVTRSCAFSGPDIWTSILGNYD